MNLSLKSMEVYECDFTKIRLGSHHDGGYVIYEIGDYDALLSCGIGWSIEFELDFIKRYKTHCIAFDNTADNHTVDTLSELGIEWHKKFVVRKNTDSETNLHEYLSKYKNVFLKMDIEESEYSFFESLNTELLNNIKQMVVEFHYPYSSDRIKVFEKIKQTHKIFHVHANNWAGFIEVNGVKMPQVIEATFIRNSEELFARYNTITFPTSLDSPNNSDTPDIELKKYPFVQRIKLC